jgi:3-oxoacyl-[acyl-carrier-protein] synthase-3
MAFLSIPGVEIKGIATCVPKEVKTVKNSAGLTEDEAFKLSNSTGIYERRVAAAAITTSDLCQAAAEKLIAALNWNKEDIDALVFVTQTPDYQLPATAPILQHKLGLGQQCLALDISLGCSGYIYGLSVIAALVSAGKIKKALLLVGDTISKICSVTDKSTYPLFGDAGTATALGYNEHAPAIKFNLQSDGEGYKAIIVNDGGARSPYSSGSAVYNQATFRNGAQLVLEGMDIFSFGISKGPEVVKNLLAEYGENMEDYDYFIFHQANKLLNEKIRKKLGLDKDKVPYSLAHFGNTSGATIPLTITTELKNILLTDKKKVVLCGFGVGLSWGAAMMELGPICMPDLIEI